VLYSLKVINKIIMHKKGFTLVELLVVIAIFCTVAGVLVLTVFNTSRCKGADASIKANLANIRAQSAIIYKINNNYSNFCDNPFIAERTATVASIIGGKVVNTSVAGTKSTVVCHLAQDLSSWAISSPLKKNIENSWCVDSSGASKGITAGYLRVYDTTCP